MAKKRKIANVICTFGWQHLRIFEQFYYLKFVWMAARARKIKLNCSCTCQTTVLLEIYKLNSAFYGWLSDP